MPEKSGRSLSLAVAVAVVLIAFVNSVPPAIGQSQEEATPLPALAQRTHFHGIAAPRDGSGHLYLATHHGLYTVDTSGTARRLSDSTDDFMGFSAHPTEQDLLYASGHPQGGGNLGIIVSRDGGRSWERLAGGVDGPVDFHQMTISPADPEVIYGVHGSLQRSSDGGRTWSIAGRAPEGIIDLAASTLDADTLYAATRTGLLRTRDGGGRWQAAHPGGRPVSMIEVVPGGTVYAFIVGEGLVRAHEPELEWRTLTSDVGGDYILHLAGRDEGALYAVTYSPESRTQSLQVSRDGGVTWRPLGG